VSDAGAVNVLYGTADGLSAIGNQFWTQNVAGILDASESGDQFGFALAAGDFGNSGVDDLAIGVPGEDVATIRDAGGVNVLYGAGGGLGSAGNQFWTQDTAGVLDAAESGDQLGLALATANLGRSAHDDLAIGAPENIGVTVSGSGAGGLHVIYGSTTGVTAAGNQFWTQDSPGVAEQIGSQDGFGLTLPGSPCGNVFCP
jgi:hypothetical protein